MPLLAGGFLRAPGLAFDLPALVWSGAILTAAGLALVLAELLGLVRRAPGNRTLVVSRTGVALSCFHVAAALVLGAFVFSHGDASVAGISHAAVGARAPAARGLRLADRAELWTLLPES